jgi:hypothetical protein
MAYLTFAGSEEKQNTCFQFIGTTPSKKSTTTHLISNNTSLIAPSYSEGMDTCSFYSGPSDAAIMAFGSNAETSGSVAYAGESCGSVAYAGGGESCGSVASASVSSSSSGGFSSYSC